MNKHTVRKIYVGVFLQVLIEELKVNKCQVIRMNRNFVGEMLCNITLKALNVLFYI